jgi:16S rRNA (cytidine1402-2'-O)-methyltransferase
VSESTPRGRLVVIATPIGNLGDLTPRAAAALGEVTVLGCEDTRRTRGLLSHLGVRTPRLLIVNEHTESQTAHLIADLVSRGERVGLVSDAGTPAVSDPGQRVVEAVLAAGGDVEVLPGASAVLVALVGSGLATGRFLVEGFLPRSGSSRRDRLDVLAAFPDTVVAYEAPHRLVRTLDDLAEHLGADRPVTVCRELTKLHEQWWRGSLGSAAQVWRDTEVRGEFVLVIGPAAGHEPASATDVGEAVAAELAAGQSPSAAARNVAALLGISKKVAYAEAVRLSAEA